MTGEFFPIIIFQRKHSNAIRTFQRFKNCWRNVWYTLFFIVFLQRLSAEDTNKSNN